MKAEYDLASMKQRPNPYARKLKKQLLIRTGDDVIDYFKGLAEQTGLSHQELIALYLRDCVATRRKLHLKWAA